LLDLGISKGGAPWVALDLARTGLPLAVSQTAYNANNQLTTWGTANPNNGQLVQSEIWQIFGKMDFYDNSPEGEKAWITAYLLDLDGGPGWT